MKRRSAVSTAAERSTKFWAAWRPMVLSTVLMLSNLYAGEIKEVGAKVTLGQKDNCFHLD